MAKKKHKQKQKMEQQETIKKSEFKLNFEKYGDLLKGKKHYTFRLNNQVLSLRLNEELIKKLQYSLRLLSPSELLRDLTLLGLDNLQKNPELIELIREEFEIKQKEKNINKIIEILDFKHKIQKAINTHGLYSDKGLKTILKKTDDENSSLEQINAQISIANSRKKDTETKLIPEVLRYCELIGDKKTCLEYEIEEVKCILCKKLVERKKCFLDFKTNRYVCKKHYQSLPTLLPPKEAREFKEKEKFLEKRNPKLFKAVRWGGMDLDEACELAKKIEYRDEEKIEEEIEKEKCDACNKEKKIEKYIFKLINQTWVKSNLSKRKINELKKKVDISLCLDCGKNLNEFNKNEK